MRVAIAGVPKAGKTTLSAQYGQGVRHTDDLLESHNWHDASTEVARWFNQADVVEGVRVPHALRKWLADHPTGKPVDRVVWLSQNKVPVSDGQKAMGTGLATVWEEIRPELERRGVEIEIR